MENVIKQACYQIKSCELFLICKTANIQSRFVVATLP